MTEQYVLFNSLILNNLIYFGYTMFIIFIISYYLYYKRNGKSEFLFTYLLIGVIVFQICLLLRNIPLDLGFALGLFAVFAIIRYRTSPVSPREMTYLFVVIGIAVLDGLVNGLVQFYRLVLWDLLIILSVAFAEYLLTKKRRISKQIVYEKIELLEEGRQGELKADLEKRLAIKNIDKVKVGKVNFLRDTADLVIYFRDETDTNYEG